VRHAIRKHLIDFIALVAMFAVAIGVGAYVLHHQRLRFPLVEKAPFRLKVELATGQAVTPGQGQSVQVAGVKVGDIGKVDLQDGRAVVTLDLDPKYKGLVRSDATALLRSKTGLKDMLIEIAPGHGRPLREGEHIPLASTAPDVNIDEIVAMLDSDTRDYLKLLISGTGKGLRGRGADLREAFRRLGPLHRDVARVAGAFAQRRHALRRLVNRYGLLASEVGRSDHDITRLVTASDATFEAFASQRGNLSRAVAELPGSLRATRSALQRVDLLGQRLPPALEALRPAVRQLDPTTRAALPLAHAATPIIRDRLRPLARAARSQIPVLGAEARDLAKAGPDLDTAFLRLNRLLDILAYNPHGAEGLAGKSFEQQRSRQEGFLYWLAWNVQAGTSAFAGADGQGIFRRFFGESLNCNVFVSEGAPKAAADLLGDAGLCNKIGPSSKR